METGRNIMVNLATKGLFTPAYHSLSIGVATLGRFSGATHRFGEDIIYEDAGSSDGWWLRSKPQVVVRSIIDDDKYDKNKPAVEIIEVKEGDINDKHEYQ